MMQLHSWQRQNFDLEQLQLPVERKQLTTMGLNHAAVEHAQKMYSTLLIIPGQYRTISCLYISKISGFRKRQMKNIIPARYCVCKDVITAMCMRGIIPRLPKVLISKKLFLIFYLIGINLSLWRTMGRILWKGPKQHTCSVYCKR